MGGDHAQDIEQRHRFGAAMAAAAWLDWYRSMGVTELDASPSPAADLPRSRPAAAPSPPPTGTLLLSGERSGVQSAREVAMSCRTLDELAAALDRFDGCALRLTATRLCFADGNPDARVMLIGEAPGSEEDRQGRPFVGKSGQLLDRMLATVGLDRSRVWITNVIFWRPPGNRAPTPPEIAICQPFLERQIQLIRPALIVFVGGIAARALLERDEGVTRLRGRRYSYAGAGLDRPIPALVMFHPAYLLRQPLNKQFAWRDLLAIKAWLQELSPAAQH